MAEDIREKVEKLKMNLIGIDSILELFESLNERRLISEEEVEDTKLQMKYAKEQILNLAVNNKKLLLSLEKEEMP